MKNAKTDTELFTTVFKLMAAGFSVIPSGTGKDSKAPAVDWKQYQATPADEAQLQSWQSELTPRLWGIVTNDKIGIIEADTPEARAKLAKAMGEPHVVSPRGGAHWYFDTTGHPFKTVAGLLPGIDARGVGGFVNIAGSSRFGKYQILDLPIPGENLIPFSKLPKDILAALNGGKPKGKTKPQGKPIPEGERNATLVSLAGALRRQGADQAVIENALRETNAKRCIPPLTEQEILTIAQSISQYEPHPDGDNHRHYNRTDYGNAERLVSKYGSIIRYSPERKLWLIWIGKVWEWDMGGIKITKLAKRAARRIYNEAGDESDDNLRKEIAAHAKATERQSRLDALISSVESEPGVAILQSELDTPHWLLNVNNGTIDLKTGTLKPHDKTDLITRIVPIDYDTNAKCPQWERFISEITRGDAELGDYLQLIFGVCLTGDMLDQVFFYLFGLGQNGKSTLTDKLLEVTGDYGMRVDSEMFMLTQRDGGATEAIANIRGKRVIVSSEVPEGRKLNTGLLKDLAGGGEALRARRLYEHEVEFKPTCKIVMFGNNKPSIGETTLALWRRLKLVPFNYTVSDTDRDAYLGEKLKEELPGILAWAVQGCLNWQAVRFLDEPAIITAATREYRSEEDLLSEFLADRCELGTEVFIDQSSLKKAYLKWCEDNSLKPLGPKKFASRLAEKNCKKTHIQKARSWLGVTLKSEGIA